FVRPLESIAETQPQLQPARLRLSAIISQYPLDSCFCFARQTAIRDRNAAQFRSLYRGDCPHFPCFHLFPASQTRGGRSETGMKRLITAVVLISLFACQAFACEHSALARVTVYWPGDRSGANAAWNGARLSGGHCAVDPKKIPYGSKVVFHDAECLAVDSGPDVVNRKAARLCGRSAPERDAIVIDRFFY